MEKKQIIPKKVNNYTYVVEKEGTMQVPLKIFASEKLMEKMLGDRCIEQGVNSTILPGIRGHALMMPDAHQGYGFSIGGVAAVDTEEGCISPGAVGFDIDCGVRLLTTNVDKETVQKKIKNLLENLYKYIPPGVGEKSVVKITEDDLMEVLSTGVKWALKNKYGVADDAEFCEEHGTMAGADPSKISVRAKARGRGQLGTLGAGNHFVEVQYVEKIYDKKVAETFGLEENQIVVMIHTGSRGLGHQVCSDYLRTMEETFPEIVKTLPDKDLIYAPAKSKEAKDYYAAMCAAANFAWTNRHMIGHHVRQSFKEIFGNNAEVNTLYDVAHNIVKLEDHMDGEKKFKAYVHRKGATRAFGPGREEIPKAYRKVGQPIIIPGSMGTASYVLVGTEQAMQESFGSTAHGAGRLLSRHESNRRWTADQVRADLEKQHITIKAASWKGITEEAPGAYKDVDEVVRVSDEAGIGKIVARLKPIGVIKG